MFPDKLDDISCHSEPPLREDKIHEESLNPTKRDPSLTLRMTMIIIIIQIIAALLIAINPYGWKIWTEIWEYFGQNYYKMHISEWVPSYVFPIFWKILIIQTIALVMVFYSFYKKKINFTHTILFCAFYYAAFMYKRQAIFVGLLAVPIFEKTIAIIAQEFSLKKIPTALGCHPECSKGSLLPKFITILFCATLILLSGYYIHAVHFTNDVWNDVILAKRNSFPYQAITFLKNTTNQPIKIFNEFSWGGYLNWTLPNALVYFDGRGTATWMYDKNKTMLEHYFEILDNQNGLKEIEKDNADYIFLKKPNFTRMAEPDTINNWFFDTNKILKVETTQLEKDINISTVWKKVYSDKFVNIWQNINRAPR